MVDSPAPAPGSRVRRWAQCAIRLVRADWLLTSILAVIALGVIAFGFLVGFIPIGLLLVPAGAAIGLILAWRHRRRRSLGLVDTRGGLRVAVLGTTVVVGLAMLGLIQLVPYGKAHANPPSTGEPQWATPETRDLMERACFQCHSNLVDYPWYSNVAPMSWALENHIDEARSKVNFSEFATDPGDADDSIEEILSGSMPPAYFTRFGRNPEAVLTDEEIKVLVEGLRATPGMEKAPGSSGD